MKIMRIVSALLTVLVSILPLTAQSAPPDISGTYIGLNSRRNVKLSTGNRSHSGTRRGLRPQSGFAAHTMGEGQHQTGSTGTVGGITLLAEFAQSQLWILLQRGYPDAAPGYDSRGAPGTGSAADLSGRKAASEGL